MKKASSSTSMRESILELGQSFLLGAGYNGFSFQDIADKLKIRKPSLHYYFRSKEELGVSVIDDLHARFRAWSEREDVRTRKPVEKLQSFIAILDRMYAKNDAKLCPTGILSATFHDLPPALCESLRGFHETHRKWLREIIADGVRAGEFAAGSDKEESVDLFMATLQGALQIARVREEPGLFRRIGAAAIRSLS